MTCLSIALKAGSETVPLVLDSLRLSRAVTKYQGARRCFVGPQLFSSVGYCYLFRDLQHREAVSPLCKVILSDVRSRCKLICRALQKALTFVRTGTTRWIGSSIRVA